MYMYYNPAATNTYMYMPNIAHITPSLVGAVVTFRRTATDTINDSPAPQTCAPFISRVFQRRQYFVRANGRGEAVASKPNGRPAGHKAKERPVQAQLLRIHHNPSLLSCCCAHLLYLSCMSWFFVLTHFFCIQSVFDVIVSAVLTAIRLELRYNLAGADDRSLQQKKPQS